jgi:hypothetical protein
METNGNQMETNYECDCGKKFITNSGLWKHKKKCLTDNSQYIDGININDKNALVIHLLKQNTDLQHKIMDMSSKSTITNNTNNTTNNTFNLNVFLNETCKDAMNISDFVSSIKMELDDLEHVGRTGYIQGISNILIIY